MNKIIWRSYEKEHSVTGSLPESVPVPIMHQGVEENTKWISIITEFEC
jgi:hypothetical protein